jgi:hypothetical protein
MFPTAAVPIPRPPARWALVTAGAIAAVLLSACAPEPFSPPLGGREEVVLDVDGTDGEPMDRFPLRIEGANGEPAGTLEAGKARKGWTLFYRTPGGEESLLWGVDRVGELFLVSRTADGRYLRLYWYTPGLFGANAMITQVDTRTAETVTRRARKEAWIRSVKILRSGSRGY